jgi:hypothetical protein
LWGNQKGGVVFNPTCVVFYKKAEKSGKNAAISEALNM